VPGPYQTRGTRRAQRAAEGEAQQQEQTQEERADNEGEAPLPDPGDHPLGDDASTVVRSRQSSIASEPDHGWEHVEEIQDPEQAPSHHGLSPSYSPLRHEQQAEAKEIEHPQGSAEVKQQRSAPPSLSAATTLGIEQPPGAALDTTERSDSTLEHLNKVSQVRAVLSTLRLFWEFDIVSKEDLREELIQRIVVHNQDPEEARYEVLRIYNPALDIARAERDRPARAQQEAERHQRFLEFGLRTIREAKEAKERERESIQRIRAGLLDIQAAWPDSDQEQAPIDSVAGIPHQEATAQPKQKPSNHTKKTKSASTSSAAGSSSPGGSSGSSTNSSGSSGSGSSSSGSSSNSSGSSSSSEEKAQRKPRARQQRQFTTSKPTAPQEIEQPRELTQARPTDQDAIPPSTERGFPHVLQLSPDLEEFTASSERRTALQYFDLLARAFDIRTVRRAILAEYQRIYTPHLLGLHRTAAPHQRLEIERRVDEQVQTFYRREFFWSDDFAYHLPTNHPLWISSEGLLRFSTLRSQLSNLDRRIQQGDLSHIRGRFLIRQVLSIEDFYQRLETPSAPRGLYSRLLSTLRQSFRTFVFLDPVNQSRTIDVSREFSAILIRIREAFEQNNIGLIIDALRLTAPNNLHDHLEDRIENFVRFIGRSEFAGITWNFSRRRFCIQFNFPVPHRRELHITADGHLRIVIDPITARDPSWTFQRFQGAQEELRTNLRITVQLPPRSDRPSPQPVRAPVQQRPNNNQQPGVQQQERSQQPARLENIPPEYLQSNYQRITDPDSRDYRSYIYGPDQTIVDRLPRVPSPYRHSENIRTSVPALAVSAPLGRASQAPRRRESTHREETRPRHHRGDRSYHHPDRRSYRDDRRSDSREPYRRRRTSRRRESTHREETRPRHREDRSYHHPDRRSYRDDRRSDSREPYRRRRSSRSRSREDRDYYPPSSCREDYRRRHSRSR